MSPDTKMIALFDVLGFENRLRSDGLRDLVAAYRRLADVVRRPRGALILDLCAEAVQRDDGCIQSVPALGALDVEQTYFSDTILLWGVFDRARFWTFCDMCADFFCEVLHLGMPVRGGISVGEAHMDKGTNTYLGYPLVEAARVEKAQEWVGVSFGPSFMEEPFRRLFRIEHVIEYTGHRKPGMSQYIPGLALDWPRRWRKMYGASPCEHVAGMDNDPAHRAYYRRAIEFAELSERLEQEERKA